MGIIPTHFLWESKENCPCTCMYIPINDVYHHLSQGDIQALVAYKSLVGSAGSVLQSLPLCDGDQGPDGPQT